MFIFSNYLQISTEYTKYNINNLYKCIVKNYNVKIHFFKKVLENCFKYIKFVLNKWKCYQMYNV